MTSNVDVTKPTNGKAFTADVRANFAIIKDEITQLQNAGMGDVIEPLPITGGQMQGPISLHSSGINTVDAAIGTNMSGGDIKITAGKGDGTGKDGKVILSETMMKGPITFDYPTFAKIQITTPVSAVGAGLGLTIQPAQGTTNAGGAIYLYGGHSSDVTGAGGDVYIIAGQTYNNVDKGGNAIINGGYGYKGNAGDVMISGGDAGTGMLGGDVIIEGGTSPVTPGEVILKNLPTVAPTKTGALWRDPVTNVLYVVP